MRIKVCESVIYFAHICAFKVAGFLVDVISLLGLTFTFQLALNDSVQFPKAFHDHVHGASQILKSDVVL